MVYRLGKRVKPWKHRIVEKGVLFAMTGVLSIVSTAYAANKRLYKGGGTYDQGQTSARFSGQRSKSKKSSSSSTSTSQAQDVLGNQTAGSIALKDCGVTEPAHQGLTASYVPELRKLAEYEQVCGGAVANRVMIFLGMPASANEAAGLAKDASYTLKELARFGISPLVILEPVTSQGFINYASYKTGGYDIAMDAYFDTLKAQGITDAMMGLWVPFPESNIPEWGNTNPVDVAACITKTAQFQKKYFPSSKTSVLFDSKSYPNGNSWDGGSYASLVPYVKDIPKGLIDSFGLQGYPWPDEPADYNAAHFVNPDLAKEAASVLGVNSVWLSTGTFAEGKAWNGKTITLSPAQRQTILADILNQAGKLQASGLNVSLNLFAENKLATKEAINWSYWSSGNMATSPSTGVFKTLAHDLRASNIDLWLFDSMDVN
jgi:hypothetical protein